MAQVAKLIDVTKCTACRGCQVACKQWNELPVEAPPKEMAFTGTLQSHPDLAPNTFTIIQFFEEKDDTNTVKYRFRKTGCMHCTDAACILVCEKKALTKLENGIVYRDKDKCIGCGYCAQNCPFQVPKVNPKTEKATKCTLCGDRIANKMKPACVTTCITGALDFGPRDEMLKKAKKRVETLQKQGVANANIYGEKELGGTNVIYVLADKPEAYGLPADPQIPLTATLWQQYGKPIGAAVFCASFATTLFAFFLNRKKDLAPKLHHHEGGKSHGV
ncbi:MAG: 4Fe-4S dicluster domain-containing protein [Heliobacteriaceae bacterium]|nr:4Fe-4S dicluster domain-containing protein [Heliobacteriaceae bacterium]MDD4588264.1 4Fe-4S dicluster domain-containing protein [Heliobacteriaceae bacterium]